MIVAALAIGALAVWSLRETRNAGDADFVAVSFNRDIRPILSETCFNCHGFDEHSREAGLRLDIAEGAFSERDGGGRAIVPGDLAKSEAWERIVSDDPDEVMPPPDSHFALTDGQKETIRRWIVSGAEYEDHWAFIAPEKTTLPSVEDEKWSRSPIDRFVFARLKDEGLKPSQEADRRTLIRRLSFDLTGLPPSLEEIRAFVDDDRSDAYERLVDRLLASPHFGERMALAWLDQARYADTNGYSRDGARTMWLWRDWVIQAYNEDKPFDAFLTEQIAGDLLPNATTDQLVATGFSRNHMITAEGGTIPEENLTNYAVDRVKTTSEAFLGLTMACAQCHDHKYDPISMKDYYRMFAYFNTLDDKGIDGAGGINARPTIETTTPLKHGDQEILAVRNRIEASVSARDRQAKSLLASWEKRERQHLADRGKELTLYPLTPLLVNTPNIPPSMVEFGEDGTVYLKEETYGRRGVAYSFAMALPEGIEAPLTGARVEFYPNEAVRDGSLGYGVKEEEGAFGVSAVSISSGVVPVADFDLNSEIDFSTATASYSHPDYPATDVLDPRWPTAWSPLGRTREPQHLTLNFREPVDPRDAPYFSVMLNFQQIANPGFFKVFAMSGIDDGTNTPAEIRGILRIERSKRSVEEQRTIESYHALNDPRLQSLNTEIAILERRLSDMTDDHSTQVMNTSKKARKTHILERGSYDKPGEEVDPGVMSFLLLPNEGLPENRLGLAQWLTDPQHPLTARVAVNRIWQMLFGVGFVSTSADFGSQGEWPSHPDLLDYLAVDFVENGWSVKGLVKEIAMSSTYRQASVVEGSGASKDPENRLLWRGPRFRLQAEFIRDAALKSSGLMNDWVGGASVKPYQPRGIWREISHYGSVRDLTQVFVQDHGSNLYRRSMYTLWKRTSPPPTMMAFDAPNRELCVMRRESTNTPLQALTLLNDPQFVEAGRAFAERILSILPDAVDEDRLRYAFEVATSRPPEQGELNELLDALLEQRRYFRDDPRMAKAFLEVGESSRNADLDPVEHAALSVVANLIFNLSEAITKG